jgi:hypothetical protein
MESFSLVTTVPGASSFKILEKRTSYPRRFPGSKSCERHR